MKKLVSVLLIVGMMFGACAIGEGNKVDPWLAISYIQRYGELESATKQIIELVWLMAEETHQKMDKGVELLDCEIDAYIQCALAIIQLSNLKSAQGSVVFAVTGANELAKAVADANASMFNIQLSLYESWRTGDRANTEWYLNSLRKTITSLVYPDTILSD